MPTSVYCSIERMIYYLRYLKPASVLDVGVGNGKMGFLVRDYLEIMTGQTYRREAWRVRLDGIEAFENYIQDHQKALYDRIIIGDAFELIDALEAYDLIILGDVLEHFEKEKAWAFLDKCASRTKHIVLNIPLGEGWSQDDAYGNVFETHRSLWRSEEIEPFACARESYALAPGEYGSFLIDAKDYAAYRRIGETVKIQLVFETTSSVKRVVRP